MLDYYKINDSESTPEYRDEDKYIASLSLDDFRHLDKIITYSKEIDAELKPFEDHRLNSDKVEKLLLFCDDVLAANKKDVKVFNAYTKLKNIIKESYKSKSGFILFYE